MLGQVWLDWGTLERMTFWGSKEPLNAMWDHNDVTLSMRW